MNYRHQYHAGNFADVVKHVLLVRLLRALQQKEKGFVYFDTHAGRGAYDLQEASLGDSLAREPEWPAGVGRLWSQPRLPPALADYVNLVREFDRSRGNLEPTARFYPGSPWIARQLVRPQDRIELCEMHPVEAAALRRELATQYGGSISVHEMDGYVALRAMLPPRERRALVLIDPPYEAQNEFAQAAAALGEALRRFPTGVYALWYPLTQRARVNEFVAAVLGLTPPPTFLAELAVVGDYAERKLKGCGLIIVNPPWRFDTEAATALDALVPLLAQETGAAARTTWLVPEK